LPRCNIIEKKEKKKWEIALLFINVGRAAEELNNIMLVVIIIKYSA
jgi:hypothetical protein